MDWLAELIADNYATRISDPSYISQKRESLAKLDRLGAMRAIASLDDAGRAMMCKQLGIERLDLEAFLRVLKAL